MFCYHKYDKIQEDGFQYCMKCGIARKPEVQVIGCQHQWEIFSKDVILGRMDRIAGELFVLRCSKCGDVKEFRTQV